MQLIIDIQNESIADKIKEILNNFKNDGIEIHQIETKKQEPEWTDGYIEKNWKEIALNTHSSNLDDDVRLYDAAWEFYRDKHSD
jgi:hypothetical protein